MTLQEFCKEMHLLAIKTCPKAVSQKITSENIGICGTKYVTIEFENDEQKFSKELQIVSDAIANDDFCYTCFPIIDKAFEKIRVQPKDRLMILAHVLNQAINQVTIEYLIFYLKGISESKTDIGDEEKNKLIKKIAKEMRARILNLRKYINEEEKINPVSIEDSNINDLIKILFITPRQAQEIINECNRLYIKANKVDKPKQEFKLPEKQKKVVDISLKEKQNLYNILNKYIDLKGETYIVLIEEFINDDLKLQIMMLALKLNISEENKTKILLNIAKHNQKLNEDKVKFQILETKRVYFSEIMTYDYETTEILLKNQTLVLNYNYQYLFKKLIEIKSEIDNLILEYINEGVKKVDLPIYLAVLFESLKEILTELLQYNEIKNVALRIRKNNKRDF
ncbi:MAG: hypothetical protein IJO33_05035 [Bacilli bacterium]|nr:hypothetical protein [Bacilli bacterium]